MEKNSNKKICNIINIIISILIGILIFIEMFIWLVTFIKDNSTINVFGYKPYILTYDEPIYNLQNGDLVFGKELQDEHEYIHNTGIIYKVSYKNDKNAVFLNDNDYDKIKNNSFNRYEGKFEFAVNKLGKVILFFREIYMIIAITIFLMAICIIVYIIRLNKKENLSKAYIRNRRIKDSLIILFIVITYASIFFIGRLNKNTGIEVLNNSNTNNINDNVENNIENKIDDNIENYVEENDLNNYSSNMSQSNNINQNANKNNNINKGNNSNNNIIDTGINFTVTENGKSWNQVKNLNIFKNNYFNNTNKIAPGISGNYEFKVKNQSKYNMNYIIKINENNEYNVNLKYKIKKNGQYLNSEYSSIENLKFEKQNIKCYETDVYIIEWKWEDSDNDTDIGTNSEFIRYNLDICVNGEME